MAHCSVAGNFLRITRETERPMGGCWCKTATFGYVPCTKCRLTQSLQVTLMILGFFVFVKRVIINHQQRQSSHHATIYVYHPTFVGSSTPQKSGDQKDKMTFQVSDVLKFGGGWKLFLSYVGSPTKQLQNLYRL